ncbi:hypothetical protein [Streptomyces sp. Je 1-332]|uniref:hypothetical protein n=1 Tax=Streptomyces sp. Je 1-332 TaxID=3231270 RepID=UPI003457E79E
MEDASEAEPQENAGQATPRNARTLRIVIALAVSGGAAAIIWWLAVDHPDLLETGVGVAPLAAVAGVVISLRQMFVERRAEAMRISVGRERVREAEEGLEAALRPGVTFDGGLVVHGDLVLPHPDERGADEGRGAEGIDPADAADEVADRLRSAATGTPRLTLPELWTVTHRRLDLYHEIALGQAARSFRNAQVAMVLGFVLLVAFVVVALQASTTAGSVVAGGLGAVAAGLAGYVSRTFVRSQEAAAGHLRAYFDQPLEFSRYLAAERLVADSKLSDEQRAGVVTALAQAMIAGPNTPPDASGSPNGNSGGAT